MKAKKIRRHLFLPIFIGDESDLEFGAGALVFSNMVKE